MRLAIIVQLIASWIVSLGVCFAQTPTTALPIFEDRFPPPNTIDGFVRQSTLIVVGRVEGLKFEAIRNPLSGRERDTTAYQVRIASVIKSEPGVAAGQVVTVVRSGGQHLSNGRLVRSYQPNFEDFAIGNEYVLFLAWSPEIHGFDVIFGPDSAFQVAADRSLRPLGRSEVAKARMGEDVDTFVGMLRRVSK